MGDPETIPAALRERKKAATYQALREAALELCAHEGLEALTVDAICLRANVSRRTFFNYFPQRDDALIGWSTDDHAQLVSIVVARPDDEDPLTAVAAALSDFVATATTAPLWQMQIALLFRYPRLRARFSALSRQIEFSVAQAVSQRTQRATDDLAVTMLAAVALAAVRATLTRWFAQPATNVRQLFDAHIEVLREGFNADLFAPKPPSRSKIAPRI